MEVLLLLEEAKERLSWLKESGNFCRGVQEPESKLAFCGCCKDQGPGQQGLFPAAVPGLGMSCCWTPRT